MSGTLEALIAAQSDPDGLVLAEPPTVDAALETVDGVACAAVAVATEEQRAQALLLLDSQTRSARRAVAADLELSTLERFATGDADAAVVAVRRHVAWLASCRPSELRVPACAPTAHASGTFWVAGRSRDGDVVLAFDAAAWHPWAYGATNSECSEHFRKYATHVFATAACVADAGVGSGKFVVLVLMADRPALVRPVALRCVYGVVRLLYEHHPRRLEAAYLLGAPPLFSAAWNIIRPWLDEDTVKRTTFVKPDDIESTVRDRVSHEALALVQDASLERRCRAGTPLDVARAVLDGFGASCPTPAPAPNSLF